MEHGKNASVTLIGMPAVGKSIAGRELAKRLGYAFIDTDEIIERRLGMKLQQILDAFGDERFIEIEEEAILEMGNTDRRIISPGGSIVYSEKAMKLLSEISQIVFLNVSFRSIERRLANKDTRGIVGLKKKDLKALFDERLLLYRKYADIEIELLDESDVDAVVTIIIRKAFSA
jgi:shikimate kinase